MSLSVLRRLLPVACLSLGAVSALAGALQPVSRDIAAADLRALGFTKVAPNATVPTMVRPDEVGFNMAYAPAFLGQSYATDELTGVGVADNGIPSWRPQDQGMTLVATQHTALRDPELIGDKGKGVLAATLYQQVWRKANGAMTFAYRLKMADSDDEGEVPDYQINYLRLVGYAPRQLAPYDVQVGWVMSARSGQFGFQAAAFTQVTESSGVAGEFYTSVSRCTALAGCTGGVPVGGVVSLRPLSGTKYDADTLNFRLDLEPSEGYSDTGWFIVDTNATSYRSIGGNSTYLDGATAGTGGATKRISFAVLGPSGGGLPPTARQRR
jgi:hypothetical protein